MRHKTGRSIFGVVGLLSLSYCYQSRITSSFVQARDMSSMKGVKGPGHTYTEGSYYRDSDGVRITHDPFAPGMTEKYGKPGATDREGFDPYGDSVGPGIYGGIVKRDAAGEIVIGRQYQNHNSRPGPVYAGGGYAPICGALKDVKGVLAPLLAKYPDLVNSITTGGAQPLHMCGMGQANQHATSTVIAHGGDVEALDTYGMTPLHRMASNNLPFGAKALLEAGADPSNKGMIGETPETVARGSSATSVLAVLKEFKSRKMDVKVTQLAVDNAGEESVNGVYHAQAASVIPKSFDLVCKGNNWDTAAMWAKLNGGLNVWYKHSNSESYVYFNLQDAKWWMDGPDGLGRYTHDKGRPYTIPAHGWTSLKGEQSGMPQVRCYRSGDE